MYTKDNKLISTHHNLTKFGVNPVHIALQSMKALKLKLTKSVLWHNQVSYGSYFLRISKTVCYNLGF